MCRITYPGCLSIGLNEVKYVLLLGPGSRRPSQLLNRLWLSALSLIYLRLVADLVLVLTFLDELLVVIASVITCKEVPIDFARVCMLSLVLDVRGLIVR
jgi:hypothetical protein